jgi:hypothetical protein
MITRMESSHYLYGDGSSYKLVWANRKEGQGGGSEVHSRLWRETALLRATGGSVLEGISSEEVRWLSPFFKHV